MRRTFLLYMGFLSLLLLLSGYGAVENSIAWHIGLSSSSQIETVQIYEGYSAADIVDGVIRAKSADITNTAEGKRFVQSLFPMRRRRFQSRKRRFRGPRSRVCLPSP